MLAIPLAILPETDMSEATADHLDGLISDRAACPFRGPSSRASSSDPSASPHRPTRPTRLTTGGQRDQPGPLLAVGAGGDRGRRCRVVARVHGSMLPPRS